MTDADPHPELRCRCVARYQVKEIASFWPSVPDPYYDRCEGRATQEDGYCDHCRSGHTDLFVFPSGRICIGECCQTDRYYHQDLAPSEIRTPCLARIDRGANK